MESDDERKPTIIIDNGSCLMKSGFGGEFEPRSCFKTCVGYPHYSNYSELKKEFFFGVEAEANKDKLKLNYPIKQGVIENWDDMEKIWGYIFTYELRVDPIEYMSFSPNK